MKERLQLKKWLNGITNVLFCLCLLVVILIVLQVFVVTSFKIPSDSMEPSLLAGDCILVDKCSGGARLFNVLDAVEKKEVKIQRMSGWRNYQRNDVLVFNFPYPGRWDSIALDVMLYYVKRCIAMPGDTLEIRNTHYRVSGFDGIAGNVQAQEELDELISSGMTEERGLVLKSFPDGGYQRVWASLYTGQRQRGRNESGNTVAVSERDRVGTEKETDIAWRFGSAGGQCDTQLPLL